MVRMNEFDQPIGRAVTWSPPEALQNVTARGRWVALAPLTPGHAEGMWSALGPDVAQWTYMGPEAPANVDDMRRIVTGYCDDPATLAHVITDLDGTVLGMASYLRIQPSLGSVEIGSISYGRALRRSRAATEAMTMFARHAFDSGFRRYEWKCDALNAPSRSAALRLGFRFEGIWRDAMVYKGRNRDTAWYAMTEDDWRRIEPVHEAWLASAGEDGQQVFRLSDGTASLWDEGQTR